MHYLTQKSFILGALFYFILSLYCCVIIYFTLFTSKKVYSFRTNYYPLKINETWMETFLENNNITLLSAVGFLNFISYTIFENFGINYNLIYQVLILSRPKYIGYFYHYKIPTKCILVIFIASIFTWFFLKTGREAMNEEIEAIK